MDDSVSSCPVYYPLLPDGCSEKYLLKLTGNRDIEDSLERLDKLTQEEARMASAEQLKMTHSVDHRVRDVRGDVQDVGKRIQDVDDKLDQANRSSSL